MRADALPAKLVFSGTFGLLLLLLLEGILRLHPLGNASRARFSPTIESDRGKFCVYDAALGWRGKPNAAAPFSSIDCGSFVRQNENGFRGPIAPADGRATVAFLGDSYLWGYCVNDDDVVTARFQREAGPNVVAVNFGVSGYGTDQELLAWRERPASFRPPLVLLFFFKGNDLEDNRMTKRYGYPKPVFTFAKGRLTLTNVPVPRVDRGSASRENPLFRGVMVRLILHSALAAEIVGVLSRYPTFHDAAVRRGWIPGGNWNDALESMDLYRRPTSNDVETGWRQTDAILAALCQEVRERGTRLVVVDLPTLSQADPSLWRQRLSTVPEASRSAYDVEEPDRRLAEICDRNGIDRIDLLPAFRSAARPSDLYFPINQHWTAAGHALAAKALSTELRRRKLLSPS
jgi:hypothetical protein